VNEGVQVQAREIEAEGRQDQLADALEREMGMQAQDARQIAGHVLAAFGGAEELDDREIEQDLRSVFYELEEHKLLDFRRETYRNEEGHTRRAFYWTIRWDQVQPDEAEDASTGEGGDSVYEELPQNAWTRGSAA
jgi:hypothetical protein